MNWFKMFSFLISGVLFILATSDNLYAKNPEQAKQSSPAPRLVVGIVVDQLRADYLERFESMFLPVGKKTGGFRKLKQLGAQFTRCHYEYSATNTGPGHATFLSGTFPSRSGIVSNNWFDRKSKTFVYCVEDTTVSGVGNLSKESKGRRSPKNLLVPTLGDHIKAHSPNSKVIGLAIKDRGAILPAGHKGDAAYWYDSGTGVWVSSTYYFPDGSLPAWVKEFNDQKLSESFLGKTWTKLLPDNNYPMVDDVYGEGMIPGETSRAFPHQIKDLSRINDPRLSKSGRFDALLPSPFGHELTTELAKAAIRNEKLGQRGVTDLLTVSYSSLDYCGHIFGPMSQEIQDMMVRLDRQLDEFFEFLDAEVGLENCLIVLTADHGVCPLPEFMDTGLRLNQDVMMDSLKIFVEEKNPKIIKYISKNEILLDYSIIEELDLYPAEIESFVANKARQLSYVAHAFTRSELIVGGLSGMGKMVLNSYNPNRNGDVYILYNPYVIISKQTGTSHGTPYPYDTHVPLLFYGAQINSGVFNEKCSPANIAPTLHQLLGLPPVQSDNAYDVRVLSEVITP